MTTRDDTTGHGNFVPENLYADEAKARWGHTDAYKQSRERVKNMTKEQFAAIGAEGEDITKKIAALKDEGKAPADPAVREQIDRHWKWIGHFYDPSIEMYRGLADLYVGDPRFAANYEKYGTGFAEFLRDAMHAYCDAKA